MTWLKFNDQRPPAVGDILSIPGCQSVVPETFEYREWSTTGSRHQAVKEEGIGREYENLIKQDLVT